MECKHENLSSNPHYSCKERTYTISVHIPAPFRERRWTQETSWKFVSQYSMYTAAKERLVTRRQKARNGRLVTSTGTLWHVHTCTHECAQNIKNVALEAWTNTHTLAVGDGKPQSQGKTAEAVCYAGMRKNDR